MKEYEELIGRLAIAASIIVASIVISHGLSTGLIEMGIWLSGR